MRKIMAVKDIVFTYWFSKFKIKFKNSNINSKTSSLGSFYEGHLFFPNEQFWYVLAEWINMRNLAKLAINWGFFL